MSIVENIPGALSLSTDPVIYPNGANNPEARLARRAELKRKRAEAKIAEMRVAEIDAAIQTVNDKLDSLAAEHVRDCAPIQQAIRDLDDERVKLVLSGGDPFDPSLSSRRQSLTEDIAAKNAALEKATDAQRVLLETLKSDRYKAAIASGWQEVESQLLALARPELIIAARVARSAARWAALRLQAAKDGNIGGTAYHANNPTVAAEIAAAEVAHELAQAASEESHRLAIETD